MSVQCRGFPDKMPPLRRPWKPQLGFPLRQTPIAVRLLNALSIFDLHCFSIFEKLVSSQRSSYDLLIWQPFQSLHHVSHTGEAECFKRGVLESIGPEQLEPRRQMAASANVGECFPRLIFESHHSGFDQEEVTTYWVKNFETSSRHILKPEYASNPAVKQPYKWAHLDPVFIDQAIAQICEEGKEWPKHFYELGRSDDRKVNNWVLKWLLWHVCRYRDWRNRKNKPSSSAGSSVTLNTSMVVGGKSSHLKSFGGQANGSTSRKCRASAPRLLGHCDELKI